MGYHCCKKKIYPCLRYKCGIVSAELTKTASPTTYSAVGQIITYQYAIRNTGSVPLCFPIEICDDRLGSEIVRSYINPGETRNFTRVYTITSSDLTSTSITNTAQAFIHVKCKKIVCTNSSSTTITLLGSDLTGTINQVYDNLSNVVTVTIVITNLATSGINAQNVSLVLPFPLNVSNVTNPSSIIPASLPVININNVTISETTIPIGASYVYSFQYTPSVSGGYNWTGTITSTSFDPNTSNNTLTNTIIIP